MICNSRFSLACFVGVLTVFVSGCGKTSSPPHVDQVEVVPQKAKQAPRNIPFSEYDVPPKPQLPQAELVALGKTVYEQNCAVCHGAKGDGQGEAAPFLVPRPRNFIMANYRLRTTPTGSLPTDNDLFREISLGMPGTPMPPWHFNLNDKERWGLVEYVKSFSPKFASASDLQSVELGNAPEKGAVDLKKGHELYLKYGCVTCHGASGMGDGPNAGTLVNDVGQKITPRNLTKPRQFKSGYSVRDITRTILTGFNGTPMLGFAGTMQPEEAWEIAYYIQSLGKPDPIVVAQASRDELRTPDVGKPDVEIKVYERAWKYHPDTIRVKQGQVIEITFEPTENGLGAGHGFAVSGYDEVAFLNGAMVGLPKKVKFKADRAGEFTYYCATQCSTDKLHPLMNGTLIVEESEQKIALSK
jgi:mono/diheme cytochrome c family protein